MIAACLPHFDLLDPRSPYEAAARPLAGAVNIPADEIEARTSELPPRGAALRVAGGNEGTDRAVAALRGLGRGVVVESSPRALGAEERAVRGRLWSASAWLETVLPNLSVGRALDVACGSGRDAVFLAAQGWQVLAVDWLPDALDLGRGLAARYAPGAAIDWRCIDLEQDGAPADGAGVFEAPFDLITVFRYLHRPLFCRFRDWLAPGGSLVFETFTTLHRRRHGKPSRDAHVLRPGELQTLLEGWEIRSIDESWRGDAHTARAWAVRPSR